MFSRLYSIPKVKTFTTDFNPKRNGTQTSWGSKTHVGKIGHLLCSVCSSSIRSSEKVRSLLYEVK